MIQLFGVGLIAAVSVSGNSSRCQDGTLGCELVHEGCLEPQSCFETQQAPDSLIAIDRVNLARSEKIKHIFDSGLDSISIKSECMDAWVLGALIRGAMRDSGSDIAFVNSLLNFAGRLEIFDYRNPQHSIGLAWLLVREKNASWYDEIRPQVGGESISIGSCVLRFGNHSPRCSLANQVVDSLSHWFVGLDFLFSSQADSVRKVEAVRNFYRQAYSFPARNYFPDTYCRRIAKQKNVFVDSSIIEELGDRCLKKKNVSACKELVQVVCDSPGWVKSKDVSSWAGKVVFDSSDAMIDSLIMHQFGAEDVVFVQDVQHFLMVISILCPSKLSFVRERLASGSLIVVDGTHWLPRAEMNVDFALWFYGSSFSTPGVQLQKNIDILLNMGIEKQRECLLDADLVGCGLIKVFLDENKAVNHFNKKPGGNGYLVGRLSHTVSDWPSWRSLD